MHTVCVYVCMILYVCVHACPCMNVCMYLCNPHLHVCMYVCNPNCTCMCVCMNVCNPNCTCMCVCTYVCKYTVSAPCYVPISPWWARITAGDAQMAPISLLSSDCFVRRVLRDTESRRFIAPGIPPGQAISSQLSSIQSSICLQIQI